MAFKLPGMPFFLENLTLSEFEVVSACKKNKTMPINKATLNSLE
jgi:hypothetical protein